MSNYNNTVSKCFMQALKVCVVSEKGNWLCVSKTNFIDVLPFKRDSPVSASLSSSRFWGKVLPVATKVKSNDDQTCSAFTILVLSTSNYGLVFMLAITGTVSYFTF